MCFDTEDLVEQCYAWQKGNMSVRSWAKELTDKLHSIGLAFASRTQQECNVTEIQG